MNFKSNSANGRKTPMLDHLNQSDKMILKYEEYLTKGDEPRDLKSSRRNLFHDSNLEDRKYFRATKKFWSKRKLI
jgi:hypothetical protein